MKEDSLDHLIDFLKKPKNVIKSRTLASG